MLRSSIAQNLKRVGALSVPTLAILQGRSRWPFSERVFLGWLCANQVFDKIIPTLPHPVTTLSEAVSAVWKHQQIEVLIGIHQLGDQL